MTFKDLINEGKNQFVKETILSDEFMEILKAQAGQLLLSGISKEVLDEEIKVLAVSFYVARLKLKEQLIPDTEN